MNGEELEDALREFFLLAYGETFLICLIATLFASLTG